MPIRCECHCNRTKIRRQRFFENFSLEKEKITCHVAAAVLASTRPFVLPSFHPCAGQLCGCRLQTSVTVTLSALIFSFSLVGNRQSCQCALLLLNTVKCKASLS